MRFVTIVAAAVLATSPGAAHSQTSDPSRLASRVRAYVSGHDSAIVRELSGFLALPNLASDSANIRRNADHLVRMMAQRGVAAQLLESGSGGPPVVYGELLTPGATKTVVFYAHYDGQPVDTTQWGTKPWQPVLRDGRIYARSASDDKAPIVAMLSAIDALKATNARPSVNLKLFFDGEEEAGSPHLHDNLARHASLLRADAWLFGDGPIHQSRRQEVVFGVRGVTGAELTIYGPSHALHSGHYGNWAPNPVTRLANLISSMRDDDGRILIRDFYKDVAPITAAERKALAHVPSVDSAMRAETELGATEARNAALVERILLPALNLRGIRGGNVGATASNSIPTEATASIDFRLVPNQTPEHVRRLVEAHLASRGYFVVDHTPTAAERMAHAKLAKLVWEAGYPATRVAIDSPLSRAVVRATQDASLTPIVTLPSMGGSLPLYEFERVLHTPLIVLPIVNHDNNQHAANENLRLQNLWDGIAVYSSVLASLGVYWR